MRPKDYFLYSTVDASNAKVVQDGLEAAGLDYLYTMVDGPCGWHFVFYRADQLPPQDFIDEHTYR